MVRMLKTSELVKFLITVGLMLIHLPLSGCKGGGYDAVRADALRAELRKAGVDISESWFEKEGMLIAEHSEITDEMLCELISMKEPGKLTGVYLGSTNLSDKGLQCIGNVRDHQPISRIMISNTFVTSKGLRSIEGMATLRWLDLSGCTRVDTKKIGDLLATLPNLENFLYFEIKVPREVLQKQWERDVRLSPPFTEPGSH